MKLGEKVDVFLGALFPPFMHENKLRESHEFFSLAMQERLLEELVVRMEIKLDFNFRMRLLNLLMFPESYYKVK